MKLIDVLSLLFSLGFLIIGIDQSIEHGFYDSYWLFMISIILLFVYSYRKAKRTEEETEPDKGDFTKKKKR